VRAFAELGAVAVSALVALPAQAGPGRLSFVQIVEKEWTVTPSRPSVRAGNVSIELVNFGMDNHDLVVKSTKPGAKAVTFKQLDPRGRAERTLRLTPGRYQLWCSIAGHRANGMHATFVVTR
jgi:plastocyanin